MSQVWEQASVGGSELLVLLALADYANDDGTSIYPSMPAIAEKSRLSVDQARRVIHKLTKQGVIELVEQGGWVNGRNRSNEYRIVLDARGVLASYKGGTCTGTRGGTRAGASTVLAPVQEDPSLEPSVKPNTDDDDNARARGDAAVFKAWAENIPGTMTPILSEKLHDLTDECGVPAVIHGIVASVEAGARNFNYIAKCARNHAAGVEPAKQASGGDYRRHRNGTSRQDNRAGSRQDNGGDTVKLDPDIQRRMDQLRLRRQAEGSAFYNRENL